MLSTRCVIKRLKSGKVAPISVAGKSSKAEETRKRPMLSRSGDSESRE